MVPKKQTVLLVRELLGVRGGWWEAESMGISESGLPTHGSLSLAFGCWGPTVLPSVLEGLGIHF